MSIECRGNGECLPYTNNLNKNILFQKINKCKYKCKPVICSNYQTCGNTFTKWSSVSYNSKLCEHCYYTYAYNYAYERSYYF